MFPSNATFSSRSSSNCSRNSSLRTRNPLSPKTSYNPLFRHSDGAFTSFDASQFTSSQEHSKKGDSIKESLPGLERYNFNFDLQYHDHHESITPRDSEENVRVSTSKSCEHQMREYDAREFLERYSLPRVVQVHGGQPLLLYRCFDSFTKVEARSLATRKAKEKQNCLLEFPEGYTGWFSLINDKEEKCALAYTSILQLIREQVCSFISIQPFTAYQAADVKDGKVQYIKTQVHPGQLFQLRAVFQHKKRLDSSYHRLDNSSMRSSGLSRSFRNKDISNRYAQLVSQSNQELYAPLNTNGEFYETHTSIKAKLCFPGMLDKTGPLALDKDCLYRISHLLPRVTLPLKVKLISGPLPPGLPKDFTDTFILDNKCQEPLMVTCTLPPPNSSTIHHQMNCINLNSSGAKISKHLLGFDSENQLFKSQRLQTALSFCHKNVENWYREVRVAPSFQEEQQQPNTRESCNECDDKLGEEKTPRKWYRHFRLIKRTESEASLQFDRERIVKDVTTKDPAKGTSLERYKDMSKLIEEKFGRKGCNPVKKSASFMFLTKRGDLEEDQSSRNDNLAFLKCKSLDNELNSHTHQRLLSQQHLDNHKPTKPDLIPTLTKSFENSYISQRLYSKFHVKTKIQKKVLIKSRSHQSCHESEDNISVQGGKLLEAREPNDVIIGSEQKDEEIPYVHVADRVESLSVSKEWGATQQENIYTEICEDVNNVNLRTKREKTTCECDNDVNRRTIFVYASGNCNCNNRNKRGNNESEYCYVKLGSNGDSVTQSDSDEAFYNTLR